MNLDQFNNISDYNSQRGIKDVISNKFYNCKINNLPSVDECYKMLRTFDSTHAGAEKTQEAKTNVGEFIETQFDKNLTNYISIRCVIGNNQALNTTNIIKCLNSLISPVSENYLKTAGFYVGNKKCGSHLHNHAIAFNFLLKGQKQWFMFPNTTQNESFVIKNNFLYETLNNQNTLPVDWMEENRLFLKTNVDNFQEFIQNEGELAIIPRNWYHAVYNINSVCGIVYQYKKELTYSSKILLYKNA